MSKSDIKSKIDNCLTVSKNNYKIFAAADRAETLAKTLPVAILVFGLIIAVFSSFEQTYSGYSGRYEFNFGKLVLFLVYAVLSAAVIYGSMTGYSILIRCLAEISQNSLNTARLTELQITMLEAQLKEKTDSQA